MSDFLTDVLVSSTNVVAKEVTVHGKTGTVHFRRITAGERHQLLRGQKVARKGSETAFELDLALNEEQQQRLVLFSICHPDGKPFFKDIDAVRKADATTVQALYTVASKLDDAEGGDAGKG